MASGAPFKPRRQKFHRPVRTPKKTNRPVPENLRGLTFENESGVELVVDPTELPAQVLRRYERWARLQ